LTSRKRKRRISHPSLTLPARNKPAATDHERREAWAVKATQGPGWRRGIVCASLCQEGTLRWSVTYPRLADLS